MVQIQVLQKPLVVDLEDVQDRPQESEPPSLTSIRIREQVNKKKGSSLRGLMIVGTALLVVMLVSRTVWMKNFWMREGLDKNIQIIELAPAGFGHEVGKIGEVTR